MAKVLFQGDGQATSGSAIWYLIVFGVVGALTTMCVAFALPIGPWWMWLLANVPFIWLGKWEMGRSAMTIELSESDGGALRLKLGGRGASLDEELRPGHERWTKVVNRNIRYGGLILDWNVVVYTTRGRRIGFKSLGGAMKGLDWPERRDTLDNGPDTYSVIGVIALEKALVQAAARTGAA